MLVGPAYRLSLMGAFTAPVIFVLQTFALLAPIDQPHLVSGPVNPWLEFHASISIIAYGAFALAGIAGVMYLVQERQLKRRQLHSFFYHLPPLSELFSALTRLLWLGFALYTAGLVSGLLFYPAALQLYHNGYTYIFVDFATGACCFLVIAGVAGIISRFPRPAKVFGLVGAFSYGLYLIHQPYVIWLGLRIREQPIPIFLLIAAGTLAVLSAWGILLEKATNALVNKLFPARAESRPD